MSPASLPPVPEARWDWIGLSAPASAFGRLTADSRVQSSRRCAGGALAVKLVTDQDVAGLLSAFHSDHAAHCGFLRISRLDLCVDLPVDLSEVFPALGESARLRMSNGRITWAIRGDIRRLQRCIYDKALQLGLDEVLTRAEVRAGADFLERRLDSRDLLSTVEALPRLRVSLGRQLSALSCGIPPAVPAELRDSRREAHRRQADALRLLRLASQATDSLVASRLAEAAISLAPHLVGMAHQFLFDQTSISQELSSDHPT